MIGRRRGLDDQIGFGEAVSEFRRGMDANAAGEQVSDLRDRGHGQDHGFAFCLEHRLTDPRMPNILSVELGVNEARVQNVGHGQFDPREFSPDSARSISGACSAVFSSPP